jgi:hypothetical protein
VTREGARNSCFSTELSQLYLAAPAVAPRPPKFAYINPAEPDIAAPFCYRR